jgi:hypothetical protein
MKPPKGKRSAPRKSNTSILTDWKDHIAKTVITMALGGLGTLVLVSGSFILKSDIRTKKFSNFVASEKEYLAKYDRRSEFCNSAVAAVDRASKRITQLNEYVQSHKNQASPNEINQMVEEGSEEAAKDSGLLAGYSADTTGLPVVFHRNVNEFFGTELDFWRGLNGLSVLTEKNSNAVEAKRLEILDRSAKLLYSTSLLTSSWKDMATATNAEGDRNVELANAVVTEAQHENAMMRMAWRVLLYSILLFFLLGCILVLDRVQKILSKKQ